jgi:diguanylate cyclase (GGDEF)-like protein
MSSALRTLIALVAVAIVGGLDAVVAPRLIFTPVLGAIVALGAWYLDVRLATIVACAAGTARLLSELAWYEADALTAWNALAWTAAFVALAQLIAGARARAETVGALERRVSELVQVEHSFARTDPLTSLCNRRAFIDALQQAEARSRRSGGALAVARLDIDNFHRLNDTYSRADGDQLLRGVATSLALTTRMGDLAARLENDEFAILLYGCGPDDAQRVGHRLVAEIEELGRAYPEARSTASIGIACFASPGPDPDEMMRLAGAALRRARQSGGNTAIVEREWTPPAQI